jgi:SAM-dependent methyltransferase
MDKLVLDACCSTRSFWFNKQNPCALYCDIRQGTKIVDVGTPGTKGRSPRIIAPDMIVDFRDMPFDDNSFYHVVFDPPHHTAKRTGKESKGTVAFNYGILEDTWRDDLRKGFSECFRVLKPNGTLIFKWFAVQIPLKDVLALTDYEPLYGHRSGKKAQTHWVAFIKEC